MDLSAKPLQNPAVLSRKIFENEMVLVNADSAVSLALSNPTAVSVWEMVNGKNSIKNIIDGIKNQFKNVPDTVTEDVQNLLDLLKRDGFIGFEYENPS